jgi:uncharacterized protein YlxW (UPF0749 family)
MLAELMNNHLDAGYAAAAKRREVHQPPSSAARWARSVSTMVVLILIGAIMATAYREEVAKAPDAAEARAGLIDDVKRRSAAADDLQREADELREQVTRDREAALADTAAGQQTARDLMNLEMVTGLGPVSGPGVVVTVGDGPPPEDPVTGEPTGEPDLARVQDRDLQELVNALWRAGAEAVAVDGQRLTPTSTIRLAGEAVLVDLRPVTSPYSIEAIGDPDTIGDRFSGYGVARRFRSYIQKYGMSFKVGKNDSLDLPAAADSSLFYAYQRGASPKPTPSVTASPTASPSTSTPAIPNSPTRPVPSATGGGR